MSIDNNIIAPASGKMSLSDFEAVFRSFYRRLYLYAYSFVMDEMEAEDIVQDAFSIIWERRGKLPEHLNIEAYLFASVKHACLKYFRRLKIVDDYKVKQAEALLFSFAGDDTVLEEDAEIAEAVKKAIQQLTPQQACIVELYVTEGLKYSEIAKTLDLSENTVKTHLKRAYKILREHLAPTSLGLLVFVCF